MLWPPHKLVPTKILDIPVPLDHMVKLSGQTIIHHVSGSQLMTDPKTRSPTMGSTFFWIGMCNLQATFWCQFFIRYKEFNGLVYLQIIKCMSPKKIEIYLVKTLICMVFYDLDLILLSNSSCTDFELQNFFGPQKTCISRPYSMDIWIS